MSDFDYDVTVHPAARLFPRMFSTNTGADHQQSFQDLQEDIRQNGQRETIKLWNGQILDGQNRWQACRSLKIVPRTEDVTDQVEDPYAYVASLNLHRRHLKTGQLAALGLELMDRYKQEAADRQRSGRRAGDLGGRAAEVVGRMVNVSARTIDQARIVQEKGSDQLKAALWAGIVTVSRAARIAQDFPKEEQGLAMMRSRRRQRTQTARSEKQPSVGSSRGTPGLMALWAAWGAAKSAERRQFLSGLEAEGITVTWED